MKLQLKTNQVIKYLTKKELSKQMPLGEYKSVSQVLAKPRSAWLSTQYKDPNSVVSKARAQGVATHKALETVITKSRTTIAKDLLIEAGLLAFEKDILVDLDEVWGQEEWLAHPLGYKGRFDGVGIFRGKLTIFDHKRTNVRKTGSGYYKQLAAYKQAHEYLYPEHTIEQVAVFNIFGKTADAVGTNVITLDVDQLTSHLEYFNGRLGK